MGSSVVLIPARTWPLGKPQETGIAATNFEWAFQAHVVHGRGKEHTAYMAQRSSVQAGRGSLLLPLCCVSFQCCTGMFALVRFVFCWTLQKVALVLNVSTNGANCAKLLLVCHANFVNKCLRHLSAVSILVHWMRRVFYSTKNDTQEVVFDLVNWHSPFLTRPCWVERVVSAPMLAVAFFWSDMCRTTCLVSEQKPFSICVGARLVRQNPPQTSCAARPSMSSSSWTGARASGTKTLATVAGTTGTRHCVSLAT